MLSIIITEFNLPLTDIIWLIDGTPATVAIPRVTIANNGTSSPPVISTLTLDAALYPSEGGQYSVTAINPAGMDTTTFNVTVSCECTILNIKRDRN